MTSIGSNASSCFLSLLIQPLFSLLRGRTAPRPNSAMVTSLSIGTQSSAFTVDRDSQTTINGAWPLFFVSATEAYLYYQDDTSNYLKYIPITISGTTATGGTEVTYHSTAVAYTGFLYNSSSKQSVSFFQDSSQTKGLAQNGALVIGTDYYVQTDGTLSTDTGGQLIGQAITTTQINIKDYTG